VKNITTIELLTEKAKCTSLAESSVSFSFHETSIIVTGTLIIPNPCHKLSLSQREKETDLEIHLITSRFSGFCVQCTAELPFKIIIKDLKPNLRTITILYKGKVLGKYEIMK